MIESLLVKESIPPEIRTVKKTMKSASVMVWGAITSNGRTPLIFIEKGVKINKEVYIEEVLEGSLKPWAMNHFKDANWVFQQDSAPSYKAKVTFEWLKKNVLVSLCLSKGFKLQFSNSEQKRI